VICFRCGATVSEAAERCPMCEQDLSAGATLAATPHAVSRRGSEVKSRPRGERSDVTHQLSVDDILDEFAADEEEFLQGATPGSGEDDTTSTFAVPKDAPRPEEHTPLLEGPRGLGAALAGEPIVPETVDAQLASGPILRNGQVVLPQSEVSASPPRPQPERPSAPRPDREARPGPALRPAAAAPRVEQRPVLEPVTGQVVELDKPKPLPELAHALEPTPAPMPIPEPRPAPALMGGPVAPRTATRTAVTTTERPTSVAALAVIGVAVGLAVATVAAIILVVHQEGREAEARRLRAEARVQERRHEAAAARARAAAAAAVIRGPEGCPQGMRHVSAATPFCVDMYEYPGGGTMPRIRVSWREAKAACELRHARLCTAAEWEAACRGEGGAEYPYGSHFEATRCNVARGPDKPREITETGKFSGCKSAANVYDMSGNVAEWTLEGSYHGGSAASDAAGARCSAKVVPAPDTASPYVGFRCCADPPRGAAPATAPAVPR
jgi:hypothetical protein